MASSVNKPNPGGYSHPVINTIKTLKWHDFVVSLQISDKQRAELGCSSTVSIPKLLVLLSIALTSLVSAAYATVNGSSYDTFTWTTHASTSSSCDGGRVGECAREDEFEMDPESSRRMLATSQYISYGALNRNKVPCNQRGASYYNCQQGAQANPYSRGCSTISRCRS